MVMGNLFTDDMMGVWNSEVYRATRRLVAWQGAGFDAASAAEHYAMAVKKYAEWSQEKAMWRMEKRWFWLGV